jgi:uncharacterized protein (TIGR03083 family)
MALLPLQPCYTAPLFRPLLHELLHTLRSLDQENWQRQTLAPKWRVRDVAAHLLDGDLRKIAVYRDAHALPLDQPVASEPDLTRFINHLNAAGVAYAARLSSRLITDLLEVTGGWVAELIDALPPHGRSIFAVSWAGEAESENWMDTGREYTERWHHQMQIRAATGRPLLLAPAWLTPLVDLSVRALPHAYRAVDAPPGSAIVLQVTGPTEGAWTVRRGERGWQVFAGAAPDAGAVVRLTADAAWRLLYNAPYDAGAVVIEGDAALAAPLLKTRSVLV